MSSNDRSEVNGKRDWTTDPKRFSDLIAEGMQRAVTAAIKDHHRVGNPVAIWREGRVVLLYPDGTTRPVDAAPQSCPGSQASD
jgi:hypothetical protein